MVSHSQSRHYNLLPFLPIACLVFPLEVRDHTSHSEKFRVRPKGCGRSVALLLAWLRPPWLCIEGLRPYPTFPAVAPETAPAVFIIVLSSSYRNALNRSTICFVTLAGSQGGKSTGDIVT